MENSYLKQTKFDSMTTNKTMQLIKAVIPYINGSFGNYLGAYIKFMEFKNAINQQNNIFVSSCDKNPENIFDDIKEFLDDKEKETIDMMMTIITLMNSGNFEGMDISDLMENFNL